MSVVGTDRCMRDQQSHAGEPFSLLPPKDIRAGLSSGLQSVSKGVLGGAVTFLAAPLVGASQDGLSGFAKGLVAGVAGAVVLPVTGVSLGVVQVVRGVMAQPAAISGYLRGHMWDEVESCWVATPGGGALAQYGPVPLLAASGLRLGQLGTDYYDLLQLPRDAPPEAVRRAYYLLARVWHPDKNPGDVGAVARFQALGEAYQVLSNPVLRARYDAHGAAGLGASFVDPGLFFGCLFGSDAFTHLVGELLLATLAGSPDEMPAAELRARQAARVQQLTAALASMLRRYVEEDVEGFQLAQREEAQRLAQASFGVPLLTCIARCYRSAADAYLGGLLGGTWARVRAGTDLVRSHLDFAGAAFRAVTAEEALEALEEQEASGAAAAAATPTAAPEAAAPEETAVGETAAGATAAAGAEAAVMPPATAATEPVESGTGGCMASGGAEAPPRNYPAGGDIAAAAAADGLGTQQAPAHPSISPRQLQQQQQQQQEQQCDAGTMQGQQHQQQQASRNTACTAASSSSSLGSWCEVAPPPPAPAGPSTSQHDAQQQPQQSSPHKQQPQQQEEAHGGGTAFQEQFGLQEEDSVLRKGGLDTPLYTRQQPHQPPAPKTDQDSAPSRAALEDATAESALAAMWAANALDIQRTLGAVTRALLYDRQMGRRVCRRRALALRLLADIYSSARAMDGASLTRPARHHLEAAFAAMVDKQAAQEEAAAPASMAEQGQRVS